MAHKIITKQMRLFKKEMLIYDAQNMTPQLNSVVVVGVGEYHWQGPDKGLHVALATACVLEIYLM